MTLSKNPDDHQTPQSPQFTTQTRKMHAAIDEDFVEIQPNRLKIFCSQRGNIRCSQTILPKHMPQKQLSFSSCKRIPCR